MHFKTQNRTIKKKKTQNRANTRTIKENTKALKKISLLPIYNGK